MATHYQPFGSRTSHSALATASLPPRVRRVLQQLYAMAAEELTRELERLLIEFEQELIRLAEQTAERTVQARYRQTISHVQLNGNLVMPAFLTRLEAALAAIGNPVAATEAAASGTALAVDMNNLRLVDDSEIDEDDALRRISTRHESRASLPLLLLGQRFGVLAGAPAFDAEKLPVGPYALGNYLAETARSLPLDLDARLLLYRLFDRQLAQIYDPFAEAMNLLLDRENILPGLAYVPLRVRPQTKSDASDAAARRAPEPGATGLEGGGAATPATTSAQAYTGWFGETGGAATEGDDGQMFGMLQHMLTERRGLLDKLRAGAMYRAPTPLATAEVIAALSALQAARAAAPAMPTTAPAHPAVHATVVANPATHATAAPSALTDLRQAVVAHAGHQVGGGALLSPEDSDTFELLGLLYSAIGREMRQDSPSIGLLERLRLPLLRLALQDRGFFVRSQHPARQLLNAVAEAGGNWWAAEEADPQLQEQLDIAVEHVVDRYDGDVAVFDAANEALQQHLQKVARKAEVSERRYVEAARGKEKLELAKRRAMQVIEAAIQGQRLTHFLRTLLAQAWADVLTLILLRHGEDSDEWRQHEAATSQIIATSVHGAEAPDGLAQRIEEALVLVGYHNEEAAAIARQLTSSNDSQSDDGADDPASRTELAMKLKARARLGPQTAARKTAARTPAEEASYQQVSALPFGSWIEFSTAKGGETVRRRLAWFSAATDQALFVNQRGHRVEEQTLDKLARLLASDQARIVTMDRSRLVDRAWLGAVGALRNIANRGDSASGERVSDDFRRKRRRKIVETIHVVDAMTDAVVGRLGNLSENGMLLIASVPLVDDALYQLRFNLESATATGPSIEVGAHLLWQDTANPQGQIWTGLRFITVLDRQLQELRDWLDAPGAAYE